MNFLCNKMTKQRILENYMNKNNIFLFPLKLLFLACLGKSYIMNYARKILSEACKKLSRRG